MPSRAAQILAGEALIRSTINVGSGSGGVGFAANAGQGGPFGSITALLNVPGGLLRLVSTPSRDLIIGLNGFLNQNFFRGIWVQPTAGGQAVNFRTANAASFLSASTSLWQWGTGSAPVYQVGGVGSNFFFWWLTF